MCVTALRQALPDPPRNLWATLRSISDDHLTHRLVPAWHTATALSSSLFYGLLQAAASDVMTPHLSVVSAHASLPKARGDDVIALFFCTEWSWGVWVCVSMRVCAGFLGVPYCIPCSFHVYISAPGLEGMLQNLHRHTKNMCFLWTKALLKRVLVCLAISAHISESDSFSLSAWSCQISNSEG